MRQFEVKTWGLLLVVCGVLLVGCSGPELSFFATPTPTSTPVPPPTPTPEIVLNCELTPGQAGGGFLQEGVEPRTELAPPDMPGRRMKISGTIYASDCITRLPGAALFLRHADDEGQYDNTEPFDLVGVVQANEMGEFEFFSIRPGSYVAGGQLRPAHIHAVITDNAGVLLSTQMLFEDDPLLAGADVPPGLLVEWETFDVTEDGVWVGTFDVVLPVTPPTPEPMFDEEDL